MRRVLTVLAVVAMVLATVPAVPVGAAETPSAIPMSVQLWPEAEPSQLLLIVSADLPADAKLPATVTLPLPEGATVLWAGEVTGGNPESDIKRMPEVVEGKGGKALRIELESARSAQYEASVGTLTVSGQKTSGRLRWVQSVEASTTSFAVRTPANVSSINIRPTPSDLPQRNSQGESLFTLPDRALSLGEAVTIDVSYSRGGQVAPAADVNAGSGASGVNKFTLILVVGGLAMLFGATAYVIQRQASARSPE